ncbi:MAG TPA: hypothetical protein VFR15_19275 [Chloroflexia bacterium]|nr:hypothetical protein [Chloroflexia bacterium]
MSQLMWNPFEGQYRGQATTGEVVTVDEDVMNQAIKKAGSGVFEVDWWIESLQDVLQHWGFQSKRWMDPVTGMPRVNYSMGAKGPVPQGEQPHTTSGILHKLTTSGPLTTRILNTGKLNSEKLNDQQK